MYDELKLELSSQSIRLLSHNSVLNCLFILTDDSQLHLFDCNTRSKLKQINFSNKIDLEQNFFGILNIQDKCIIVSDRTICSRFANEGLFLLDTVLQPSLLNLSQTSTPDVVYRTLELGLNDAISLLESLKLIEPGTVQGLEALIKQIQIQCDCLCKLNDTSWLTVQITENYFSLLTLLSQCLEEIKRINIQCVSIPIISLLLDRLYRLDSNLIEKQLNGGNSSMSGTQQSYNNYDKRYMCSEATRRATFNEWPHMDYKWVLPDALAQAGFYHQPTHPGDDRTICFVCDLCLVAWEQHDQPWSEHERHSPICQFVRGELTENVPLSLTSATQAANLVFKSNDPKDTVVCTSELSSERYFALSNSTGHIIVYDSKDILKEMMHVQLINESQYNKEHKIKIHSLCFYYRNHKHVLYGSFTINDEVFIFSFNIFDIYRSYHSKSNKKSSKAHKTTSNSAPSKASTSQKSSCSKSLQTTPIVPTTTPPLSSASAAVGESGEAKAIDSSELKSSQAPEFITQDVSIFGEGAEFQKYMNNIIKIDSDLTASSKDNALQHQLSSENSTKNNSDDACEPKEAKKTSQEELKTKAETNQSQLNTFLNSNKNPYFDNMFSLILNSENQKMTQNTNSFDLFTLPKSQQVNMPKQIGSFQAALNVQSNPKTAQSLNLSNFLNVRFEITPNINSQGSSEQASKSKSKYKKSIKILTVSCRPLNALYSNEPDIQLKSYEFTEKCLSFRLASIDLSSEQRTSFDIKLINLYEKYLCALVNFKSVQNEHNSFKLFRIKHEETSSSTMTNNNSGSSLNSESRVKAVDSAENIQSPSCLAATSSSRLNLTEFILTSLPSNNLNCKVVSIMPISVSSIEDDDSDLKFVAILNEHGLISIIDPNKCCKVIEFSSPDDDKFVTMIYCYGIDKICAVSENSKVHMISTRVSPIVSQNLIDEISDSLNLTELSTFKKLLIDAPLNSNNLSILHNLTIFDSLKTNFSAKLPACWSLVLAEQQHQRKHPQHILAETANFTKSWKYINNTVLQSQPDNLSIEIYLNKPIQIGCFQVKLKFSKEVNCVHELSIWRQKRIEANRVDSSIDFNLGEKKELIYGPVDVRQFLDTTHSKTYIITVCSPRLYETRSNLFYFNLKTIREKVFEPEASGFKDASLLQKVQLTIRKYKRNGLQYENIERGLMLSRTVFFKSTISYLFEVKSPDCQVKLIDIINWLFYNQMGNTTSDYLSSIFSFFEQNLDQFIQVCYVKGTRSTSRKATLLLTFLLSPIFNSKKSLCIKLVDCLLKNLDNLKNFSSSCSMNWFFVLLNECMHLDMDLTYAKCLTLLNDQVLAHKYDSYSTLLRMRCNLSGLIFEPRLFDLDSCLKMESKSPSHSAPMHHHQQQQQQHQQHSQVSQTTSNPFSFSFGSVGLGTNQNQTSAQPANHTCHLYTSFEENPSLLSQSSGLMEVLPLNYKSISSSSGSTIEKNGVKQQNSLYILPDYYSIITNSFCRQTNADAGLDTTILSSIFSMNESQHMIIDRMEPMSKHFVILDFGFPVCLSDFQIGSCPDISSISVDIWLNKEQKDSKRLCMSTDISSQAIVLNDLQPPPICRYLKLIFVAHSSNIVKARIPLGHYFGHPYIFGSSDAQPSDANLPARTHKQTMAYVSYLEKLYEDSKCHYSISINKLKEMLDQILYPTDNIGHLKMMQFSDCQNSDQIQKIKDQYAECVDYQFKLNLTFQLIKKLNTNMSWPEWSESTTSQTMCQDQLRVSNLMLIKTILNLSGDNNWKLRPKLDKKDALNMFNSLCVNACLDKECSWLLIRLCHNEEWWGQFIADCLRLYFVEQLKQPVHLSRLFATLNEMCVKSLSGQQSQNLFNSLFGLVEQILQGLDRQQPVEVTCLEWIFLFICRLLSVTVKSKEINRWEFLENVHSSNRSKSGPAHMRQKTKLKKKFFQSNKYLTWNKIKETRKNLEKYKKHLWKSDLNGVNSTASCATGSGSSNNDSKYAPRKFSMSRDLSLRVCKLIGKLLISANSYSSSDLFVLCCRIVSHLCSNSTPVINLNEIFTQQHLTQLIMLNVSSEFNHGSVCWGSPWSQHALLSLLLDVMESERPEPALGPKNTESKSGQSASLRMIEELDEATSGSDRKTSATNMADAVKLTGNMAQNFSQIADILTNHLSGEESKEAVAASTSTGTGNEQSVINNLVESAMNKKLEEIKNNIVTPLQQMNTLFGSSSSGFTCKKSLGGQFVRSFKTNQEMRTACIDNRLEASYHTTLETFFAMRLKLLDEQLNQSISDCVVRENISTVVDHVQLEPKMETRSSIQLIEQTLESLFDDLSCINIENLLSFWLNLSVSWCASENQENQGKESATLTLDQVTCQKLIAYLNDYAYMSVKCWHLSFRLFNVLLDHDKACSMSVFLCQNHLLYKLVYKFLDSSENMIGDECCASLIELLKKIQQSLDTNCQSHFKLELFRLLNLSMDLRVGCIARGHGPVDAQLSFIEYLSCADFLKCYDLNNTAHQSLFESLFANYLTLLSTLAQLHINTYARLSLKGLASPRSCFSSVLSSLLFGQQTTDKHKFKLSRQALNSKDWHKRLSQSGQCSRDLLICLLLKFAIGFLTDVNNDTVCCDTTTGEHEQQVDVDVDVHAHFYHEEEEEEEEVEEGGEDEFIKDEENDLLLQQLFLYELQINENELDAATGELSSVECARTSKACSLQGKTSKHLSAETSVVKRKKLVRLISNECVQTFVESLALCQSSALAMVISNSGYPIEIGIDDVQTPGDAIFLLLKSIVGCGALKLVEPAFNYLQKMKRLSEPLLWLFGHMLQNESAIKAFVDKNGIDVISKGLSASTAQLLYSGPCIVSSLMNLIDAERQQLKLANDANDSTEGFTNFAQYGSIVCTNPSGNPVDILVQNCTPHRRIRSSIWSYHFQPDENKVGLYLNFAYAFLLKEVHILPHTVSFGNCPAYVSVEVSRDGSFMTPIGPPVYTMGSACIKLQLNKSELVNAVQINLYKSKESQMIGLSQLKLLGYPMFENMLSAKPDMMLTPVEDLVSRSNMGWLRLLHMCLSVSPQVESLVCQKIDDSTMLLCTRLLCSPAMIIYDRITENILLKLSKHDHERTIQITKCLLRAESGSHSGLYNLPHGLLMQTLVNILFQISHNLRPQLHSQYNQIIVDWLNDTVQSQHTKQPSSMIFHCVACIIYKSSQLPQIDNSLFQSLVLYATRVKESYTKKSIDWLLCSLLYHDVHKLTSFLNILLNANCDHLLIDTLSHVIQSEHVLTLFLHSEYFGRFVEQFKCDLDIKHINLAKLKVLIAIADFEQGQKWLATRPAVSIWQQVIKLLSTTCLNFCEQTRACCIRLVKKLVFLNENNQILLSNLLTGMIDEACNLNSSQNSFPAISAFLHQLIVQVLLEDQTILVNLTHNNSLKSVCNSSTGNLFHPKFSTGLECTVIELALSKACSSIAAKLSDLPAATILKSHGTHQHQQQESTSNKDTFLEVKDFLDKIKNEKKDQTKADPDELKSMRFYICIDKQNYTIPSDMSVETVIDFYTVTTGVQHVNSLEIGICFGDVSHQPQVSWVPSQFSSPLETYVKSNGLTVLAERLPILMPFIHEPLLNITDKDRATSQPEQQPKTSPDFVDYVIMNESDGPFADDMYNEMAVTTSNSMSNQSNKLKKMTMPPHAFIAFGLFLKIPGYASIMMKNKKQAQSILKLLLGATRDKEDEFGLSLSTMPFSSLKDLLDESKLSQSRAELTNFIYKNQILAFILAILSSISHHPHRQKEPHFVQNLVADCMVSSSELSAMTSEEKNNLYWAKGTGFGTGSTIQQWDAEKTLMQQKMDEEHVACILEILSGYIECCEHVSDEILELIDHSCVINALSSYLRNDSVLDISRHIPLYKSALKLLQSLILSERLRALIEQCSIFELIKNMKQFVDSYTQRIRLTEEEGDFASLVPVLNTTYELVLSYVKPFEEHKTNVNEINLDDHDIHKIYCDCLKNCQFDTFTIVSESANGLFKSNLPFYYESSLNDLSTNLNNASRAKRLAQETVTLSNSLPLSFSSSVFVRCDEDRLDVMKVLITGPQDTPYANGCFEFDVFFPSDYPDSPPMINLQTTGNQTVRFNPNLYHDGKVCLSILNTWHGRPEERWNGQTSSFLQVLVSIQSLILVSEPYFNEPGYERSRGTPAGTIASIEHDANIRQATVRWAMLEMIRKPPACFKEVIQKHFYFKKKEIKEQCELWFRELESHVNDKQIGASMLKNAVALKRHMSQLFELLDKLKLDDQTDDEDGSNRTLEENQDFSDEAKK